MTKTHGTAHVGWTDSAADRQRIDLVCGWLIANELAYLWALPHDYIDLNDGRDFLAEAHEYSIVVLHHLYNGEGTRSRHWGRCGQYSESLLQSRANWLTRFDAASPKVIFAFGDWTEISADYLGEISGYTLTTPSHGFGVYHRKD